MILQHPHRLHNNVVKIHSIRGAQFVLVGTIHLCHPFQSKIVSCILGVFFGSDQAIFGVADF